MLDHKMGATNTGYVMTLANSIIGVGILAMPFCFQKCGIILSILLLILSNLITRLSCHYLLKTAILYRKRTFEFLAFHIFGSSGKLMVELCVIGYLMGTCITYFVVLGDLGPQIIAKLFDFSASDSLRTWVMVIVTISCIIPLGLLRNIESLAHICTTSIIFYFCLVIKVIVESERHISAGDWYENVALWRPSGVLQCLPILVMATSCQTNVFEVYLALPNPTLQRMNDIVKSATALCTGAYVLVGFFGYVAFNTQVFSGNVMLYFSDSLASDIIKVGFFLSVACSFPLVVFPCRATLYSLLYRRSYTEAAHYIPEHRFKLITISMTVTALLVGIMIPSIELVIGLVGSTIGIGICIMFPAACFVKTVKKNSTEKLLAQTILIFGFVLMILGTYANLNAIDEKKSGADFDHPIPAMPDVPQTFHEHDIPRKLDLQPIQDFDRVVENKIVEPPVQLPSHEVPAAKPPINKYNNDADAKAVHDINLSPILKADLSAKAATIPPDIKAQEPRMQPKPIEKPDSLPLPEREKVPNIGAVKSDSVINKDAIQKEDQEIAIADKEDAGKELKQTKELLEQVKDQLEKQNKETQKLVLEKIEKISQKVDKIGQAKDLKEVEGKNSTNVNAAAGDAMPNTVVKLLLDNKQDADNIVKKDVGAHGSAITVDAAARAATGNVAAKQAPLPQLPEINAAAENEHIANPHAVNHIDDNQAAVARQGQARRSVVNQLPPSAETKTDGAQRDLLSIKGGTRESAQDESASNIIIEREKRDVTSNANDEHRPENAINASAPTNHVQNRKESESNLKAGDATDIDHQIFVRDLRSVNHTHTAQPIKAS